MPLAHFCLILDRQLYKLIVLDHELTYFIRHETRGKRCFTENEVISMLDFLVDNRFVALGGKQTVPFSLETI